MKLNRPYNKSDRMKELVKSFEEKNEVIKDAEFTKVNEDILKEESDRLKVIARIDEAAFNAQNTGQFASKMPYVAGAGQTVNTFLPQPTADSNPKSPDGKKFYNPNYTYLQPSEALRLCIKRAIESGAPINDLGFYEEINWNLNNVGFPAKSALDIKNCIAKMIRD